MTPFIARRWPDGTLSALLVTMPGSQSPMCLTYDLPGQHGDAMVMTVVKCTIPATPAETEQLADELRRVGYPDPRPIKRYSRKMAETLRLGHKVLKAKAYRVVQHREADRGYKFRRAAARNREGNRA